MKRLFGILLAILLVALTAAPTFAQGPVHPIAPHWIFPYGTMPGIVFGFFQSIVMALGMAALGALVVMLIPNQARLVSETAQKSPLPSLGLGCLILLAALPVFVLLVVFIITIPVALLLPLALAAGWLFGWIALGWLVGERMLAAVAAKESLRVPIVAVVVGTLLLAIIGAVPLIGWVVGLGIGALGLGAVVLSRFGTRAYPALPATI